MTDATPSPYYRPDCALWSEPSAEAEELAAFRQAMENRPDGGAALWATLRETLSALSPQPPATPSTPVSSVDSGEPVVYYIRFADRVKIGTSRSLSQRLSVLPHDEVLALEAGGRTLEAERHRQFARLRIHGEWFRNEEPLTSHIDSLRP